MFQFTFLAGTLPDTLYAADSPFMALSTINSGDTLVIEAGVEIQFTTGTSLIVNSGTELFSSEGTSSNLVELKDAGQGQWGGVLLRGSSGAAPFKIREIEYTTATGASSGITIESQQNMVNTTYALRNFESFGNTHGLTLSTSGSAVGSHIAVEFTDCTFSNNTDHGVKADFGGNYLSTRYDNCYFENNGDCGLFMNSTCTTWEVSNSVVSGNDIGFRVLAADSVVVVNWNVIQNNVTYDVETTTNVSTFTSHNFNFNSWSSGTTAEMLSLGTFADITSIYDWWENSSYSVIDYSGYSGGPTGVAEGRFEESTWTDVKEMFR